MPSSISATFFGPTKTTEYYRDLYRERIHDWNTNDDIHRNLLRVFGNCQYKSLSIGISELNTIKNLRISELFLADKISFPLKDGEDSINNCSICYTYRLCNQIPIISCDNEKCQLIYHTMCLKEWFSTIRDSKTFLNVTSGKCPFCKEVYVYLLDGTLQRWNQNLTQFSLTQLQKLSTSFAQLLET